MEAVNILNRLNSASVPWLCQASSSMMAAKMRRNHGETIAELNEGLPEMWNCAMLWTNSREMNCANIKVNGRSSRVHSR